MNSFVVLTAAIEKSKGELLAEAGVNSLIGIIIVFVALLLMSFIISAFGLIYKAEQKAVEKKNEAKLTAQGIQNTVSQIAANELSIDNFELTAIITAAISEYEEAQGNYFTKGMVVRSIKKIN